MKRYILSIGHTVLFILSTLVVMSVHAQENSATKLPAFSVSETLNIAKKEVSVLDSTMSYLEEGNGELVLFIHGNPTSSYLWRNVIPFISDNHRAIAVDLIGMGDSGKPDIEYSFHDHYKYLSAFIDKLDVRTLTLVGHDWGATLAWEYARKNPKKVTKLAFMEGVLPPGFPFASYEAMGDELGNMFKAFNHPEKGAELVIENNLFVEKVLPGYVNRQLGKEAMNTYRAPYKDLSNRKPLLAWPRQVPIGGTPEPTTKVLNNIDTFMGKTNIPILLLYADPGVVVPVASIPWYIKKIKNLETSFVGQGFHFIQEDQPDAIGRALDDWMRRH
jgi:haloalkane dehalogenase